MSEPIKAGDLVVVVRPTPCCDDTSAIGHTFHVLAVRRRHQGCCCFCRVPRAATAAEDVDCHYDIDRLKRIPPLSELEGECTQEDIREPA